MLWYGLLVLVHVRKMGDLFHLPLFVRERGRLFRESRGDPKRGTFRRVHFLTDLHLVHCVFQVPRELAHGQPVQGSQELEAIGAGQQGAVPGAVTHVGIGETEGREETQVAGDDENVVSHELGHSHVKRFPGSKRLPRLDQVLPKVAPDLGPDGLHGLVCLFGMVGQVAYLPPLQEVTEAFLHVPGVVCLGVEKDGQAGASYRSLDLRNDVVFQHVRQAAARR
mmetsp:Transcript_6160/g.15158  ORF Transcript_6160/g.15158 Transcript_6160/m.15158 type:complete len:223 (-) Transcript_6160:1525-2193(-)